MVVLPKSESFRQNRKAGIATDYFNQESKGDRLRKFGSVRFGVDYFMDNRNTFTISQNFVTGKEINDETQDQRYTNLNNELTQYGDRIANSKTISTGAIPNSCTSISFPKQAKS